MVTLHPTMCRLCLQAGSETTTVSIFSIANGHVIAEIARHCLGIAIVKDSSVYENICSQCIVSLVSMYELYLKFHESNRTFLKLFFDLHQRDHGKPNGLSNTVAQADAEKLLPSSAGELEDIIEEDYSISDESEELEPSSKTHAPNGATHGNLDEPVYYLQDFGGYVRPGGEMDGLLHGPLGQQQQQQQQQPEHTDEPEWSNPDGASNKSLMEELSAQVARLDSQEIAGTKLAIANRVKQPTPLPQPTELYTDRGGFEKPCGTEENDETSNTQPSRAAFDAPVQSEDHSYQEPKHRCYICETSFHNDIELVNHFPAHFLDVPQDCTLCGTQYRTVMNLNRHLAYHQHGRPYKCDNCERRFADPQAYRWHKSEFHSRRHTQAPSLAGAIDGSPQALVCDICGKLYVLAEPYELHVRQHEHGHQQYQCKLCERSFPRNIYLLFHLETHAKQRPHRCQYCSIPFASLYLKNFHEKRHPSGDGGPVSRRCPLCLTVCRAKHRLLAHIEAFHPADTRIQLLQCSFNECRLKFLDLNEFQSHITDHRVGDRFPCTHCARVFKRQRLLNTHLRTVHGLLAVGENGVNRGGTEHPRTVLRCNACSKAFRSERTYRLHLKRVHKGTLPEDT